MKKHSLSLLLILFSVTAVAQTPKHEFRGAWIATVANLDWPTSRTAGTNLQRNDLLQHLDDLAAAGVNAVFFQVRTECDALYDSNYEPWSYYLTGSEGVAPNPYWDPLEFAIEEAHKRGMELHAWLNPYRAERSIGLYTRSSDHITNTNPDWLITSGTIRILNPGLPEVQELITNIVMDIVNRYDVDGVHFDDYFYPYPPNDMSFGKTTFNLDDATFAEHNRGFTIRSDWRRDNINKMIHAVHDSIKSVKPHVKFGISPFGIWKNGVPPGIVGMDAYSVIYADALAWLDQHTVDYLVPQLYWAFGGGQDYGTLSPWWAGETTARNRHLYNGMGAYRLDAPTNWAVTELTNQLRFNRQDVRVHGEVLFRSRYITNNRKGIRDSLVADFYRYPSFTPGMDWLPDEKPPAVPSLTWQWQAPGSRQVILNWGKPDYLRDGADSTLFYAVYRAQGIDAPAAEIVIQNAENLVSLTGKTTFSELLTDSDDPYFYYVTAVGRNASESIAAGPIEVLTSTYIYDVGELASRYKLNQNYPNPFNPATTISFELPQSGQVELSVYDITGRRVAVLANGFLASGLHTVNFNAAYLASGLYVYVLQTPDIKLTRKMMLIK